MSLGFEITKGKDRIIDLQYLFILLSFLPFQCRRSSQPLASFNKNGGVTLFAGFETNESKSRKTFQMSSLSVAPPDNTDSTQTMNLGKNDKNIVSLGEYQEYD